MGPRRSRPRPITINSLPRLYLESFGFGAVSLAHTFLSSLRDYSEPVSERSSSLLTAIDIFFSEYEFFSLRSKTFFDVAHFITTKYCMCFGLEIGNITVFFQVEEKKEKKRGDDDVSARDIFFFNLLWEQIPCDFGT